METQKRDFSQAVVPGNYTSYGYSEFATEWDTFGFFFFLAAEKAQTPMCCPSLVILMLKMDILYMVLTLIHLLCLSFYSSDYFICFIFILLYYMHPLEPPQIIF